MSREDQILNFQCFLKDVDKDITMILQNLQWDRSSLSKEQPSLTKCKYDENHKVSSSKLKEHEEKCFLKQNGYSAEDVLLPELFNTDAPTVVKFNSNDIKEIIDNAAKKDPLFKRVSHDLESTSSCLWCNSEAVQPLTVEHLQSTYTADERRTIHDAVVSSVRTVQEHEEFVLLSGEPGAGVGEKSLLEQLAEQRDRRRRRTKYRAPPKTRNYSLVLRDVICAQMELLNEINGHTEAGPSNTKTEGDRVLIKKEMEESSKYQSGDNCDNRKYQEEVYKSRHYSEKNSYEYAKRPDKYTKDTERMYDKNNKDTENRKYSDRHSNYNYNDAEINKHKQNEYYNKDTESRRHYGKSSKDNNENTESKRYGKSETHQASIHKTEEKRSKNDTNTEETDRNYSRHTKDAYKEIERDRSRRDSSKDNYKEHKDDKKYYIDEFSKSDKRKREYLDDAYTKRDRYYHSDNRKRGKYEEKYDKEKERSYSKHKSDYYRHRKDE